ncbi:MAG: hypothetical protein GXP03_05685 [Alphaproteobacteria bacterium]|nr:hypothetical protein [Alphaproteobacteria bacterium]
MISTKLENFKNSDIGKHLRPIIEQRDNLIRMTCLSEHRKPAVQAIGRRILVLDLPITDTHKQIIGLWVKEVMARADWWPTGRQGRVSVGNLFSTGAYYQKGRTF